jgi:hypothetical protein
MNKLIYISLFLLLFSCKKEEIPVAKHTVGTIITNSFEMGNDYRKQAFFDLETNSFVSQNIKTTWDLGFESGENGNHVVLNSANAMAVARVSNSFNDITDTIGLNWNWDATSGNLDSTAIGDWVVDNFIYVVNRGNDHLGAHRGFCKLDLQSVTSTHFNFKLANLDGSNQEVLSVSKNNDLNFTAFSFSTRSIEEVEPPKDSWDIQFTQYVHYFEDFLGAEDEAYLVTGILSNRTDVQVAEVFDKDYASITTEDISTVDVNSNIDAIGYKWKEYNFSTGTYVVHFDMNYIIKSTEGMYFKFHLIDFYNEEGDKGTPVFELQAL